MLKRVVCLLAVVGWCSVSMSARATEIRAGSLILQVSRSETAQVFHIVDRLSDWSQSVTASMRAGRPKRCTSMTPTARFSPNTQVLWQKKLG